jgi:electron transfer flavoprotein beta subunit
MKLCVLVKQVPGNESALRIASSNTWIEDAAALFEMNESDNYALEEALQMKESLGNGSEVVAVSMGPERVKKVIREALSKGADRGIHINEMPEIKSDPFATAQVFANVIKDENFDIIFSGLQSDDVGSGQTGIILGEMLGMATATLVMATEVQEGSIKVKRELESGWFQWVSMSTPASITIQSGINQPRYPSLKGIMGAKKKEIKIVEQSAVAAPEKQQSFANIYLPTADKKTEMIEGNVDQMVSRLVDVLKTEIKVL